MSNKKFSLKLAASLAPMAGATDSAFRLLCREQGAQFTVSEMVSAKALTMGDKKTAQLMAFTQSERPYGVQLFGYEPETMARAAEMVEREIAPDFIDINMGCPAPKITGSGAGSALMKRPQLAADITKEVCGAVQLPVTVKLRAGYSEVTAPELAPMLELAGAAAITVHGRLRDRMYKPPVDLEVIRAVKQAVSVPVIGNGDIFTPQDALKMVEYTGCDAVAVGRAALGNPFFFAQVNAALSGASAPQPPSAELRMSTLRRQIELMCAYKGEYIALREGRKHAAWYTRGLRGAARLRSRAMELCTLQDLDAYIELVLDANLAT